jgi:hypothetical protein
MDEKLREAVKAMIKKTVREEIYWWYFSSCILQSKLPKGSVAVHRYYDNRDGAECYRMWLSQDDSEIKLDMKNLECEEVDLLKALYMAAECSPQEPDENTKLHKQCIKDYEERKRLMACKGL